MFDSKSPKVSPLNPVGGGQMNPPYLQMRTPTPNGPNKTQPVLRPRLTGGMGDRTQLQGSMANLARMRSRK